MNSGIHLDALHDPFRILTEARPSWNIKTKRTDRGPLILSRFRLPADLGLPEAGAELKQSCQPEEIVPPSSICLPLLVGSCLRP